MNRNGGAFIEQLREEWLANYNVILIDSRTGLTDTSGVCTVQLPDIIIAVFSANQQSLYGIKEALLRSQRERQKLAFDRMPLQIVPLLSCFDYRTEVKEASDWLEKIEEVMDPFYKDWLPRSYTSRQIIERTKIPYIAYFSFGEKLPVVTHSTSDPEGLGFWYDAMANLIASGFTSIKEVLQDVAFTAYFHQIPCLPPKYLKRNEELKKLKETLNISTHKTVGTVDRSYPVGLLGMGGIGKSVLAAAIAYDEDVQKAFPDGAVWLTLGRQPDIVAKQRELAGALGHSDLVFVNSQQAHARLSELIANRTYLIILDDVWSEQPIEAFNRLGKNCQLLVTTRDRGVLEKTGAQIFQLAVLTPENALDLLAKCADQPVEKLPVEEAENIAKHCSYLPLVLATVGSLIRVGRYTWKNALERLQEAKLEELKTRLPGYEYPGLLAALAVSVEALSDIPGDVKKAFLDCAVFPEGVAIPETVLQMLWSTYSDLPDAADVGQLLSSVPYCSVMITGNIVCTTFITIICVPP